MAEDRRIPDVGGPYGGAGSIPGTVCPVVSRIQKLRESISGIITREMGHGMFWLGKATGRSLKPNTTLTGEGPK